MLLQRTQRKAVKNAVPNSIDLFIKNTNLGQNIDTRTCKIKIGYYVKELKKIVNIDKKWGAVNKMKEYVNYTGGRCTK